MAFTTGDNYLPFFGIFNKIESVCNDLMELYNFYSVLINNECANHGYNVLNWFIIKKIRSVKKFIISNYQ